MHVNLKPASADNINRYVIHIRNGRSEEPSPYSADAIWQTRQISIGEKSVGIVKLEDVLTEVQALGLSQDSEIKIALMQGIAKFNYIPPMMEETYAKFRLVEYYADRRRCRIERALKNFARLQKK